MQVNTALRGRACNGADAIRADVMYRDFMVPMTATLGDDDALDMGVALAREFDARLTALETLALPAPVGNPWGMARLADMADFHCRLRVQAQINVARLKERLRGVSVPNEVLLVEATFAEPSMIAVRHAHYADMTIVAGPSDIAEEDAISRACFSALLLESGRPVLVVPPRYKPVVPVKRIVVAWRPTREAARAVHDALPLLQRADQVDILVVDAAGEGAGQHGDEPGADVAAHLSRHGVEANVVRRSAGRRPVCSVLLDHARETLAHLVVAGGYGHSRLREWALGGVTRGLLVSAPFPVLYSH